MDSSSEHLAASQALAIVDNQLEEQHLEVECQDLSPIDRATASNLTGSQVMTVYGRVHVQQDLDLKFQNDHSVMQELFAKICEAQNTLSRVDSLSDDVLLMVFLEYITAGVDAIWEVPAGMNELWYRKTTILLLVCRRWRTLILNHAPYWNNIKIRMIIPEKDRDLRIASLCLRRSKEALLSISICQLFGWEESFMVRNRQPPTLETLQNIPQLVLENIMRVRKLSLRMYLECLREFVRATLDTSAPTLEDLSITLMAFPLSDWHPIEAEDMVACFESTPLFSGTHGHLRTLSLTAFVLPWRNRIYHGLRELCITCPSFSDWTGFFDMLGRLSQLEKLSLSVTHSKVQWRSEGYIQSQPLVSLAHLTDLTLEYISISDLKAFLDCLSIPFSVTLNLTALDSQVSLADIVQVLPAPIRTCLKTMTSRLTLWMDEAEVTCSVSWNPMPEVQIGGGKISITDREFHIGNRVQAVTVGPIFRLFPVIQELKLCGEFKDLLTEQWAGLQTGITTLYIEQRPNKATLGHLRAGHHLETVRTLGLYDLDPRMKRECFINLIGASQVRSLTIVNCFGYWTTEDFEELASRLGKEVTGVPADVEYDMWWDVGETPPPSTCWPLGRAPPTLMSSFHVDDDA